MGDQDTKLPKPSNDYKKEIILSKVVKKTSPNLSSDIFLFIFLFMKCFFVYKLLLKINRLLLLNNYGRTENM